MNPPREPENRAARRFYTFGAVGLLIVAALATAASWRLYPVFVDTYYHMGVIEGFSQAEGVTTRAFWELAPGGRVHIYPPSLHVIGYFFTLVGVSARTYITVVSAVCYFGCLLTTWLWLRRIIGPRGAMFAVVLLCGPYAFFWTQASFTAVAGVMVLAPLALLALETERFLVCGVVSFVAITMHPMGLFLPPALVLNALLRRKRLVAGLLAAVVPVVLYGPWLGHIWANRALLPDSRTGGEISLGGFGVGGVNLGVFLVGLSAVSVPWLIARRGPVLGLVGALLGFAVVFPMGFGGRFFAFNIHWPLACLAGYGLAELTRWLERGVWLRPAVRVAATAVAAAALVAYPALEMPLPRSGGPGGRGRMTAGERGGPPDRASAADRTPPGARANENPGEEQPAAPWLGRPARVGVAANDRTREESRVTLAELRFTVQAGALPKLFDAYSGEGSAAGMGAPGRQGWPGALPGRRALSGREGRPGRDMRLEQDVRTGRGMRQWGEAESARDGAGGPMRGGRQPGGAGGMPGGPGMDSLRRPGAEDFFKVVKETVRVGDVVYVGDAMNGSLLVGITGRWTSSGILRDVRSETPLAQPEDCDFLAVLGGGMGMGPGGPRGGQNPPESFEKVFENEYGSLYKNPAPPEHAREPLKPDVSVPLLTTVAMVGLLLIVVDLLPRQRRGVRAVAAAVGVAIVGLCFVPLTMAVVGELRNPPAAPAWGREGEPGFGPPGFGPPGGGPGGFGPGRVLADTCFSEADADRSGGVSLGEFRGLAGRWVENWDEDVSGDLDLDEVAEGLGSALGAPPGMNGRPLRSGGPDGHGPAWFLAQRVFVACDGNADGRLSEAEMTSAFEAWFAEWDEKSGGELDEAALERGLERVLVETLRPRRGE
ncbi:MAG TPA: hypothetical protein PKK06_12915 [Phycisphaerae bacterium]|nr:hypothetical protein [Phycisphaerae bacterium]HNU44381.1 hypothetical protein [Phycisphaerae bacterium]